MCTPAIKTTTFLSWIRLLLVPATMLCFSCQDDVVCEDATSTSLRLGFYSLPSEGQANSIAVDSLTVYGLERIGDTIYDNQINVSLIELPVNPSLDSTAYVLIFPDNTDTLWFKYRRIPHMISVECGFTMFFEIESVLHTNHIILTSEINTNLVSNTLDEHIKVIISDPVNGL